MSVDTVIPSEVYQGDAVVIVTVLMVYDAMV